MKVLWVKIQIILLIMIVPLASFFESTGETYVEKNKRNYSELIKTLKM